MRPRTDRTNSEKPTAGDGWRLIEDYNEPPHHTAEVWYKPHNKRPGYWDPRPGTRPYSPRYYYRVPLTADVHAVTDYSMVFTFLDYGNTPPPNYDTPQLIQMNIPSMEFKHRQKRKRELELLMPHLADRLLKPVGTEGATKRAGMFIYFRGHPAGNDLWEGAASAFKLQYPVEARMTHVKLHSGL
jgi:hypothetical protein